MISKVDLELPQLCKSTQLPPGLAMQLPEILEQACIAKTTKRSTGSYNVVITTYTLEGVDWRTPDEDERRLLEQRRETRLVLLEGSLSSGHTRPFCKLRDSPLEKIGDPSLLDSYARLSTPVSNPCVNLQRARVLEEDNRSCFVPPDYAIENAVEAASLLEVDLGANCEVTYISTQGRFPPVQRIDKESGSRVVRQGGREYNNWVSSYELSCRVASGRDWVTLGEFRGNFDMNTEVAHEMPPDLNCRYLRFRPLTYNGMPAMRAGVYGKRTGKEDSLRTKGLAAHSEHAVQYSIHRIKENANTRRVPLGCGLCRYGCAICSKRHGGCKSVDSKRPKVRRLRLRQGVVQEVRVLVADDPRDGLVAVAEGDDESLLMRSGSEASGVGAAAFAPPMPQLARQRSFSDPDLSAAASSSSWTLGDSIEVVQNIGHFDEDEWLMLSGDEE